MIIKIEKKLENENQTVSGESAVRHSGAAFDHWKIASEEFVAQQKGVRWMP
jgi:hypothetical protein